MKNLPASNFKKKTSKLYRYQVGIIAGQSDTTVGDPTNTTITILTTVSHVNLVNPENPGKMRA
jgi:hypothetical protein